MSFTYEELKKKNVGELREIAAGLEEEAVQGYTQMNKEHLLKAICDALKLDMHVHHHVVGLDKTKIKGEIRELKKKRDQAIEAKDHAELKEVRLQIRRLKKKLRQAMV
ncbi:transcription termination factor Rho [candidate division KSB1 bacterium]|nr:transcription termination factor Rho [candidate division KSB1 bacterium]